VLLIIDDSKGAEMLDLFDRLAVTGVGTGGIYAVNSDGQ
jgi:hypothetical protein